MKKILFFSLAAVMFASCTNRVGDFTVLSTKNMNVEQSDGFCVGDNRVTGVDRQHIIVIVPTGQVTMKEATDRAIESAGRGCVGLSDAAVHAGSWYIPYIYGTSHITVEGNPIYKK